MLWLRILSSNACSDSVVSETLGRVEVEHPQQRTSLKYNHFVIFMVTTNISLEQNNNSVEPITAMNVLYFAVYLLLEVADWSPLRVKISKPKSWKPPLYSNPWPLQKPSVSATNFFFYWQLSLTWDDSNQWYFSSKCIMARSNSLRYLYLSNGSSTRFHCLRA